MIRLNYKFYLTLIFLLCISTSYGATCTSTGSGDWNDTAVWDCGIRPTGVDKVIINTSNVITLKQDETSNNLTINGNLTIGAGLSLKLNDTTGIYVDGTGWFIGNGNSTHRATLNSTSSSATYRFTYSTVKLKLNYTDIWECNNIGGVPYLDVDNSKIKCRQMTSYSTCMSWWGTNPTGIIQNSEIGRSCYVGMGFGAITGGGKVNLIIKNNLIISGAGWTGVDSAYTSYVELFNCTTPAGISTSYSSKVVAINHSGITGNYLIYTDVASLAKSYITTDFTSNDNVTVYGLLNIDENAIAGSFYIPSGYSLSGATANLTVIGLMNVTGNYTGNGKNNTYGSLTVNVGGRYNASNETLNVGTIDLKGTFIGWNSTDTFITLGVSSTGTYNATTGLTNATSSIELNGVYNGLTGNLVTPLIHGMWGSTGVYNGGTGNVTANGIKIESNNALNILSSGTTTLIGSNGNGWVGECWFGCSANNGTIIITSATTNLFNGFNPYNVKFNNSAVTWTSRDITTVGNITIISGTLNGATYTNNYKNLDVNSGATFSKSTGSLITSNLASISGTYVGGSGIDNITMLTINSGGIFNASSTNTNIKNNITTVGTFNHQNGILTFSNGGTSTVNMNGNNIYNLEVYNGTVVTSIELLILNNLNIYNGSVYNVNIQGTPFTITNGINLGIYPVLTYPTDLIGFVNINRYLNVTNIVGSESANFNISYSAGDLVTSGVNEESLQVWRYTTGWTQTGITNQILDVINKVVGATINGIVGFTTIVPLGSPTTVTTLGNINIDCNQKNDIISCSLYGLMADGDELAYNTIGYTVIDQYGSVVYADYFVSVGNSVYTTSINNELFKENENNLFIKASLGDRDTIAPLVYEKKESFNLWWLIIIIPIVIIILLFMLSMV